MEFDLQPTDLADEFVKLSPLKPGDFDKLYQVASDPLIWEQHPNKDRYKKEVFEIFFEGAIRSGGAFIVSDAKTGAVIGSSRFYKSDKDHYAIGYTFLARDHWGTTHNRALKKLMLGHAFKFVDKIIFHIGANNTRSQKAIEKMGAKKIGEEEMEYYGEAKKLNFIYEIRRDSV